MRAFLTALCLGLCFVSLAGCGDEPEETGAGEGGICASASDCKSRLFCFIAKEGEDGECLSYPDSCPDDEVKCSSECMDDAKAQCPSGGSSCISVGSDSVTVTCLESSM